MSSKMGMGLAIGLLLASAADARPATARFDEAKATAAVQAAIAVKDAASDPGRSADNLKLDESRRPVDVLNFLRLRPGMRVVDMFGGNHYWAEILAPAVGAKGHVTVWEPTQFVSPKSSADFAAFAAKHPNVSLLTSEFGAPNLPRNAFDLMIINLNYHDVYWESTKYKITRMDPNAWLRTVYASMKPGGTVGVIDHIGPAGDTRAIVEKMHRIDPATVRADFIRAGFVLDGTSELLRNPADDHSLGVFDAAIRGKTDRFIMRFKKPR